MRKSSLSRRSTHIPVRVPSSGGSASTHIPVRVPSSGGSATRSCTEKKSTGALLKPSQRNRSQSADREGCVPYQGHQFQRANTIPAMLQHTSVQGNLPTGSARAPQSQMVSTDSARRMIGFGGGGKRKDTRPIAEKPFQQAAQAKVQEYFDRKASDVIGPGNSIRPMNTTMFVTTISHLLQNLDSNIVISKSNYLEDIPSILRKFGYRSKMDRSWLMTVNTPHSWQHVIAVLCWLVDLKEVMDLTDPFEMMYTVEDNGEKEDEKEDEIAIDKDMVLHLKRTYKMRKSGEDRLSLMDEEFIEKQIIDLKCTEEDFDTLQRQLDLIKEEVESGNQRKALVIDELQKIKEKEKAVIEDTKSMKEFIEKSKAFVETVEVKLPTTDKEITVKRAALKKKKKELQKIQDKVNTQEISRNEIDQLNVEKNNLQRMIKFYEGSIREYQNSTFAVDMKLAEDQKRLDKLVMEFNKLVAETIAMEPQLKQCEIKLKLLTDVTLIEHIHTYIEAIDSRLKILKDQYKSAIKTLESQKQKSETTLKLANEEINKTKEEINRERRLLEKIECDYEKLKQEIPLKIGQLRLEFDKVLAEINIAVDELLKQHEMKLQLLTDVTTDESQKKNSDTTSKLKMSLRSGDQSQLNSPPPPRGKKTKKTKSTEQKMSLRSGDQSQLNSPPPPRGKKTKKTKSTEQVLPAAGVAAGVQKRGRGRPKKRKLPENLANKQKRKKKQKERRLKKEWLAKEEPLEYFCGCQIQLLLKQKK
ncbi:kinetochore protein NDC80 homolog [Macrosteles quadrilineatus]|uniref:kinetochore protein NDC80 homolog n=1 Tax=Macrosteles quadrilineatus TaxID=74068 RepID=UPI0023E2B7B5|nr:kinetochore protein NDC80 homolog [Macrosteles quadrilineatus]